MERTNQSAREPVGWCEMNETCDLLLAVSEHDRSMGNPPEAALADEQRSGRGPWQSGTFGK